jgi:hypothetical protein
VNVDPGFIRQLVAERDIYAKLAVELQDEKVPITRLVNWLDSDRNNWRSASFILFGCNLILIGAYLWPQITALA